MTDKKEQELNTADLEVVPEQVEANDKVEQEVAANSLPDKFRGKTAEEIASAYSELESKFGKQGQELGEYRQLTDKFLQEKLQPPQTQPPLKAEPEPELDFLDAPEEAINRTVDKRVRKTEESLAKANKLLLENTLARDFPDYKETVASADFQRWIGESAFRTGLYQKTNHNYDFEAANEMFSLWNQVKPKAQVEEEMNSIEEEAGKKSRINSMTTEGGSSGQATGKVYSRKELIRLRSTDPKRYEQLAPLIRTAYAEGRVKD